MNFLLIQMIGAAAYTTLALSYLKKEKKKILFMQIIAYILFAIHYFFLNGITGALCNIIGLLSLLTIYIFEEYNWNNKKIPVIFFVILLLIVNIMTFQNIYSIFPMIAISIAILSFLTNKENIIRIIGLIAAICWLIYGIVYKSYFSILFQIVTIFNICISFFKNKLSNKNL